MILLAVKVPSSNKHLILPSILFTDNQWQEAVFEKCKKRVKAHSREAVGTKLSERHLWLVHQFTSVAKVATISLVSFRQERVTCVSKPKQTRGDNAAQTRSKWEFVFFFLEVFGENFNFWCMFFPSFFVLRRWRPFNLKPHLNLRGEHFLLFCVICPCLWENYQSHFYDTTGLMDVKYQ